MESTAGGLKGYWKSRRQYVRVQGTRRNRRRKTSVIQLTDPCRQNPRRRFWRIRVKPRLQVLRKAVCHPGWLLGKIRDAYVGMMMRFARAYGGGGQYGGMGIGLAQRPASKEYDEKVIVEMYKNMIKQGLVFSTPTAQTTAGNGDAKTGDERCVG